MRVSGLTDHAFDPSPASPLVAISGLFIWTNVYEPWVLLGV
jgi:hypothetical protein